MKESKYESIFPKDFFSNKSSKKFNYLNPRSLQNDSTSPRFKKIEIPLIKSRKKITAEDLVFAANSARGLLENKKHSKLSLGINEIRTSNSHKILPPLKPTIHISSYTPRHAPESNSSVNPLIITFSSKQIQNRDHLLNRH